MPDPVWYYARGEVERGPFTAVQIKALAHAGKLRRDDLVWKEGMESWTAAKEISELFPAETPAAESIPANGAAVAHELAPVSRVAEPPAWAASDMLRLATPLGWGCLCVGVACVIVARGCESVGHTRIARLEAAARLQADEQWQRKRNPLATE